MTQLVKNPPAMRKIWVRSLGWEDPWRRERLPTPGFWPGEVHGLYSPWGRRVGHDRAAVTWSSWPLMLFSSCAEQGLLSSCCARLLTEAAPLLQSMGSGACGFSSCGVWAPECWPCAGLVAPRCVGSSQTRDWTCLLCWQVDS